MGSELKMNKKILFLTFILYGYFSNLCFAFDVTIGWKPTSASGYELYYGEDKTNLSYVIDVGLPSITDGLMSREIINLDNNTTYYFTCKGYVNGIRSNSSNMLIAKHLFYMVEINGPAYCLLNGKAHCNLLH